jgi:hypothetical protein
MAVLKYYTTPRYLTATAVTIHISATCKVRVFTNGVCDRIVPASKYLPRIWRNTGTRS